MSYADDYEEESWLNPGIEHAIDEEHADFTGTGLRPTKKENTVTVDIEIAKARLKDAEAASRRARAAEEMRRVELDNLQREAKRSSYPEDPKYAAFRVSVQPAKGSQVYVYAIIRVGGRFFTTGRREHNYFATWEKLVDWLRENHWHSELFELVEGRHEVIQ